MGSQRRDGCRTDPPGDLLAGCGPHACLLGLRAPGGTPVLIHGFSVPYYIWDGTFELLAAVVFRVLRYDEYGPSSTVN